LVQRREDRRADRTSNAIFMGLGVLLALLTQWAAKHLGL
jgi:hypothetical protein